MMSSESKRAIEPEILKRIYVQIARIHEVDKAIKSGLSAGKLVFTYWPMTGQEAIPATLSQLVSRDDYMVTIYRGIHDLVAKGVPLKRLFAEMLGRADGVNKGKGGSARVGSAVRRDADYGDRGGGSADSQRACVGGADARAEAGNDCQLWGWRHQHWGRYTRR
jgi:TPP-dependent pyruvate/acetoin dehydrogenase alpha subunit